MDYPNQVFTLSTHALLHVEFKRRAIKPSFLPLDKSELILRKYLKANLDRPQYKLIKKLIKGLLAKKSRGVSRTIESELLELQAIPVPKPGNDRDSLLLLITALETYTNVVIMNHTYEDYVLCESYRTEQHISLISESFDEHWDKHTHLLMSPFILAYRLNSRFEKELFKALDLSPFSYVSGQQVAGEMAITVKPYSPEVLLN